MSRCNAFQVYIYHLFWWIRFIRVLYHIAQNVFSDLWHYENQEQDTVHTAICLICNFTKLFKVS